ncbi:MAG TPA: hypothetical protein PKC91_14330 [Ignavibacteria bacterium]|nr:hypothetical protein [Ignavibacteria bacterium]
MSRNHTFNFLKKYSSFTENEKVEFTKFANSGLFSRKRDYTEMLISIKPDSAAALKGKSISNQTKWNRYSELNKIADKFLLLKNVERNKLQESVLLLDEYRRRNLNSSFNQKYKNLINEYYEKPIVSYDLDLIYTTTNKNIDYVKTESGLKKYHYRVNEIRDNRKKMFLLETLLEMIDICILRGNGTEIPENLIEIIYKKQDLKQLISFINNDSGKPDKANQLIEFTYLLLQCFNGIDEKKNYEKAKKIFFRDMKSISQEYRFKFYYLLITYSLRVINSGEEKGHREFFYLINKKLKEGLVSDFNNNYYFANIVHDIIVNAIQLKKFNWVYKFIKDYSKYFSPSLKEDNINSFYAKINFEMKNFGLCIEFLNKINTRKPVFYIHVMFIRLKALFELQDYENCYIELRKLKEFLRKQRKIRRELITYTSDFCKALYWLLKMIDNQGSKNMDKIEFNFVQLISNRNFNGKKWIMLKKNTIVR